MALFGVRLPQITQPGIVFPPDVPGRSTGACRLHVQWLRHHQEGLPEAGEDVVLSRGPFHRSLVPRSRLGGSSEFCW